MREGKEHHSVETSKMTSELRTCKTESVTSVTISIGRILRKKVSSFFSSSGPNGRHIVTTGLFTCLLPVVGFHVLSRTGHSNVLDSFWLRLNNILHASGHIHYQQLYMFYGLLKGMMPRIVFRDLYTDKPGRMLARVPSYTAGNGSIYDSRGWTYVHLDEALEMMFERMLKSLNVTLLPYLESAGAWLLPVSMARMQIRTICAASRAYKRVRENGDADEHIKPLDNYDRAAAQTSTVREIVNLMRRKSFLSSEHRSCDRLKNVLGVPERELTDDEAQKLVLNIDQYGRKSVELHASSMFPDVFGPLSGEDVRIHLNKKRPKGEWTTTRRIPTIGNKILAQKQDGPSPKTKKAKDSRVALSERRHAFTKLMTSLTLAEHKSIESGDPNGAGHARHRWNILHSARYMLSPHADAYLSLGNTVRHAKKSQLISALNHEFLRQDGNSVLSSIRRPTSSRKNVYYYYDYQMPQYISIMIDVMNHIWSRGTDGSRGNTMHTVTVLKMKQLLRPWFSGKRAECLKQHHLHIYDPSNVIKQKSGEQGRRDYARDMCQDPKLKGEEELYKLGFLLPITVPWGTLLSSRTSRDAISSFYLFCGAVAGLELADEYNRNIDIYLHGGCFSIRPACIGMIASELIPELAAKDETVEHPRGGEMLLMPKALVQNVEAKLDHHKDNGTSIDPHVNDHTYETTLHSKSKEKMTNKTHLRQEAVECEDVLLQVPRNRPLVFFSAHGLHINDSYLTHEESETRFVAAFNTFVLPTISESNFKESPGKSGCVLVSRDTDVTIILALAQCMRDMNVIHVLGDTVVDLDNLNKTLRREGVSAKMFASCYVMAECDFFAGTYGVTHVHYFRACLRNVSFLNGIGDADDSSSLQLLILFAYLEKHGFRYLTNSREKERLREKWVSEGCSEEDAMRRAKEIFVSEWGVGTQDWCLDVRRYMADLSRSLNELIPPSEHVDNQTKRVRHIVFKYWYQAEKNELSPDLVGGCNADSGFTSNGDLLLERREDVKAIETKIRELLAKCKCKGTCITRHCSCVKRNLKCIGCECPRSKCQNKVTEHPLIEMVVDRGGDSCDENGGMDNVEVSWGDSYESTHINVAELTKNDLRSLNSLMTSEHDFEELLNAV